MVNRIWGLTRDPNGHIRYWHLSKRATLVDGSNRTVILVSQRARKNTNLFEDTDIWLPLLSSLREVGNRLKPLEHVSVYQRLGGHFGFSTILKNTN